ncbi:hypothetical protein EDC01DRAFT_636170 [Geopyxis carbonaria]|nr:hypothetical protein EDC01DRAFT_636170 [Geopyxis carbonaria]
MDTPRRAKYLPEYLYAIANAFVDHYHHLLMDRALAALGSLPPDISPPNARTWPAAQLRQVAKNYFTLCRYEFKRRDTGHDEVETWYVRLCWARAAYKLFDGRTTRVGPYEQQQHFVRWLEQDMGYEINEAWAVYAEEETAAYYWRKANPGEGEPEPEGEEEELDSEGED